jgi:hypothetical protein
MNYLAHALPFFDRPYFLAGSGVPDWLGVADRQSRVRLKQAEPFMADADPIVAEVAGGVVQHLRDDLRFHATRAFMETSLELSAAVRRVLGTTAAFRSAAEGGISGAKGNDSGPRLGSDSGFRASFIGHLLIEVLLDATLAEEELARLNAYDQALDGINALTVQQTVNRLAVRPTERLAPFILLFRQERILRDYLDDTRLMLRLGQVMRRVGFDPLPDTFPELLPAARELVRTRRHALMEGIPA